MANSGNATVTVEELTSRFHLASTDALAKLLIEKGLIRNRSFAEDFRGEGNVSADAQSNDTMTIDFGLILLEGVTLAVVVFGALAAFIARRWFSPSNDEAPPGSIASVHGIVVWV